MARHTVISHDDPKWPAIKARLFETWAKTIAGFLAMGGLIYGALWVFDFSYKFQLGFGTLYLLLPIVMWWFIATAITGMSIITLPTVLALDSHAGIGPPIRWCIPAHE